MKIGRISVGIVVALLTVGGLWFALSNGDNQAGNADRNLSLQDQTVDSLAHASQRLESGKAALSNGDHQQSIIDFSAALALEFEDNALSAELHYHRALAYLGTDNREAALDDLDTAIALSEDQPDYYMTRAQVLFEMGAWDAAIADYSNVIETESLAVDALVGRGDVYYRLGEYERALADIEVALGIDPDNSGALVARAAVYIAQDLNAEAVQELETALRFDADYAPAYFYRSVANYNSGEQFDALQDLNQAIQLDSQSAAAHYLRGIVYEKEGDDELALADYSRAIQLDPMYAAAYRSRSWIYARMGQINISRSDRQNAMLVDPTIAGVSVGDYDLEITRVWATNRANGRRPVDRAQFLVLEINVYNYGSEAVCLNRNDFPRLEGTERVLVSSLSHIGEQFYPTMEFLPLFSVTHHCVPSLHVWNTFLAFDTYRDITDISLQFSPAEEAISLTLLLLPTDDDFAFALSAVDGQSITVVGDVVITNEVRTKVLETRTAVVDNCLGGSDLSRTDTIAHEETFDIEIQTTVRQTSGAGAQFESVEANSIRILPPIPYIDRLLPIQISDLKINLAGQIGDTTTEETTTSESTSRVIHSSIAVTTTAAPGTRESTLITWYLVNKLGYVETNINGTYYQVPFSVTDSLEADPVGLDPEVCDER